ncbi:hypothetical protein TthAA37_07580 [Thermus thermophilus]|uniref:Uncharacterized protein n=1 Tax=Thermus thermophilus TaxID=274 RepID=A0AAD1KTW6_THETH|nr:hypothetical protein TthAA11_07290 [Thermus thermophilus]BCZ91569.1 hypothetical protein TthAA37_07580 [Thermus thermophilus]BCZ94111.1 hypothetical protein TthAK1_07280 [Thermus thermophilus]
MATARPRFMGSDSGRRRATAAQVEGFRRRVQKRRWDRERRRARRLRPSPKAAPGTRWTPQRGLKRAR